MSNKYFSFRFDVDTYRCTKIGIPNLIKLGQDLDITFTFFMSMGRAVSKYQYLKKIFIKKQAGGEQIYKLSNMHKLTPQGFLTTALFNPLIGSGSINLIKELDQHGHEIGLHGGRNHATWQNDYQNWSDDKIISELQWALNQYALSGLKQPVGFSSPGWNTSKKLAPLLKSLGFQYWVDVYGEAYQEIIKPNGQEDLLAIPTNILGEPGGIGYLEHCRAKGMNDEALLDDFKARLNRKDHLAIAYDHPYYAGVFELDILKKMIQLAQSEGFEVLNFSELIEKQREAQP